MEGSGSERVLCACTICSVGSENQQEGDGEEKECMIVLGDGELGYPDNRGTHDMNLDRRASAWRHQWWIMTTCNAVEVQMQYTTHEDAHH